MKYIHNLSGSTKTYVGTEIIDGAYFQIPSMKLSKYSEDEKLISDIVSGAVKMSRDGVSDFDDSALAIKFLMDFPVEVDSAGHTINRMAPFQTKELDGKKLFKRVHGMIVDCVVGDNEFLFTVPYAAAKLNILEMIGGEVGDKANFYVLDTATGAVTTVPNYVLNQFGFNVAVGPGYYKQKSEYDADVFAGLQLKCIYNSLSAKKVGVNFILNELKD